MNLDHLKQNWDSIGESRHNMTTKEFQVLLNSNSNSPYMKIRKSMLLEFLFLLLAITSLFVVYFMKSLNSNPIAIYALASFTILIVIAGLVFVYRVYSHTQKLDFSESLAQQLKYNIFSLQSDIQYYFILNLFMYFPAVLLAIILINEKISLFVHLFSLSTNYWLIMISCILAIFPLYYFAVKRWIFIFYGQYIEELKEHYQQLITTEDDRDTL